MKQIFAFIACAVSLLADAQNSDSTKAQFKVSVNFNSNLNYYGRTDSLKSTGVFPLAELWFSPKFYISAAPVFINNKVQSFEYAGTVTTLGYQNITEKWLTNLYLLKPFYTESSQLVQSTLKAQTSLNISRLNKILNLNFGVDIKFSDKMDFGATAGLDHLIRTENKDGSVWVIDPSFYLYAGTQNFTNTYNRRKAGSILFPTNEQVTQRVQTFNVLAYEASVPVIYVKNEWMVLFTPSYILPQNLVIVPGRTDLSERGQNMFYATIGIKYSF